MGLGPGRRPLEIAGGSYEYRIVDGERRLATVSVAGAPLVPDRTYRVATNSFIAGGGDGFDIFGRLRPLAALPTRLRQLLLAELAGGRDLRLPAEARIRVLSHD